MSAPKDESLRDRIWRLHLESKAAYADWWAALGVALRGEWSPEERDQRQKKMQDADTALHEALQEIDE